VCATRKSTIDLSPNFFSVAPSAGHAQDPTGLVSDPQIKTLGFSTAFAFISRTIKFRHNQDELPTTTDSASPPPMRASYLPMCLCPDRHRADVRLTRQMRGCVSASHRGGTRLPKRRGGVARTKFWHNQDQPASPPPRRMLLKTIIYAQTDTLPMCEKHDMNQAMRGRYSRRHPSWRRAVSDQKRSCVWSEKKQPALSVARALEIKSELHPSCPSCTRRTDSLTKQNLRSR